jgi:hypothetical protein
MPIPKVDLEDWFDFYRCDYCRRLITRLQEAQGIRSGRLCKCGRRKYHPVNPEWYEYLLPRVIKFAYERIRGRI